MAAMPRIDSTITLGNVMNTAVIVATLLYAVGGFTAKSENEDLRARDQQMKMQGQIEALQNQTAALTVRASITENDVKYIRESLSRLEAAIGTKPRP